MAMFRRDKDEDNANDKQGDNKSGIDAPPIKPFASTGTHTPKKVPGLVEGSLQMPMPIRHTNVSSVPSRHNHLDHPHQGEGNSKRLIVGRSIHLSGEIAACEHLIVEGRVEVTLAGARLLEVAASGVFKGSAQVDDAIISGLIDGDLTVNKKLTVLSGGKISGSVRYGSIIIEAGGQISGDMQSIDVTHKESSTV
jgi:cytoskeletal protein CcmA (bactofilin family)